MDNRKEQVPRESEGETSMKRIKAEKRTWKQTLHMSRCRHENTRKL